MRGIKDFYLFPQVNFHNMLLMIDNYDSFTYNLVQYFGELGEEVMVFRNDEITADEISRLKPARIVISPGPCTPSKAGISIPLIERYKVRFPYWACVWAIRA